MRDINILEKNLASPGRVKTDNRSDQSCLSHPVAAENADDTPFINVKGNPLQNIALSIVGMDIAYF
jgi:hypothetical protein